MKSRAAAKGRKLLFLAAVCLLPALLLPPTAEASRGAPAAALTLDPPVPRLDAEAPPAPRLELFHLEDDLLIEILTGVDPEHHQALLEHRRLELLPSAAWTSAIQKTASGVSTSDLRLNVQKGKSLKPNLRWTVPYYAKARFYDPEVGRFLSEDPAQPDLTTPPSLHKYLYAYGNPTRYWDPLGLSPGDPDEPPILNRVVDFLVDPWRDTWIAGKISRLLGRVDEVEEDVAKITGQTVERNLSGDSVIDAETEALLEDQGISRGLTGGREVQFNRELSDTAGVVTEDVTKKVEVTAVDLAAGHFVGKIKKLPNDVDPPRRRAAHSTGQGGRHEFRDERGRFAHDPDTRRFDGKLPSSPNFAAQKFVQGRYIDPVTNKLVYTDEVLSADHIIPQRVIVNLPGFAELTYEQQTSVLNYLPNFQGLPRSMNSSKGGTLASQWTEYAGQRIHVDYLESMRLREARLLKEMEGLIRDLGGGTD